eukprot:scaffold11172_cov172-Amphora_coffeaeformis.AAC.16
MGDGKNKKSAENAKICPLLTSSRTTCIRSQRDDDSVIRKSGKEESSVIQKTKRADPHHTHDEGPGS